MKIPDITEVVIFGPDGGFNTCKAVGARVTDLTTDDIPQIRNRLITTEFYSYWAPLSNQPGAVGRIMESPVSGIVGKDAKELQPTLWTTSLSEDHYNSPVWQLFFWTMLYDVLDASEIPDGAHVKVFTALGLPYMHMGYANALRAALLSDEPHVLSRRNDKSWYITIDASFEIQVQPFWIAVDQVFRWTETGLIPDASLLDGGLWVLDFGSKTLNGVKLVNKLIPVDHISVGIGTWDVVKNFVAPEIETLRQQRGITVGDIRWQTLMDVYESGQLQIGRHKDALDISAGLAEYNRGKVEQRLKDSDTKLDGAANTHTIIGAGGDVYINWPAFEAKYAENVMDFRIATDDDGHEEPKYRQMYGLGKGAIKAWAEASLG